MLNLAHKQLDVYKISIPICRRSIPAHRKFSPKRSRGKNGQIPYKDKRNIERFENNKEKGDVRCGGNVWFIPHKTVKSKEEKFNHPTCFPEELVRKCIMLNGYNKDTTVLDPFAGVRLTY